MVSAAVVLFPGSNCDRDALVALERVTGITPHKVWHADTELPNVDLVVLPGGFSHGDYLRCGAMAAHAPILAEVKRHADRGGLVLGICNGFQVLTESHLLPGALIRNASLHFICKPVTLKVESNQSPLMQGYEAGQVVTFPVAHHDGNYIASDDVLDELEGEGRVALRYCTPDGEVTPAANINGSARNIAGITSAKGNVLGMMPHPERAVDATHGGTDGTALFAGINTLLEKA